MTPHELTLHILELSEKARDDHQNQLRVAYFGERLHRVKKLPDFDKLFEQQPPKKEQTADDMLAVVKNLNAAFGGDTF